MSALAGTESPWEEVELPSLESHRDASINFKTPKKLPLGEVLAPSTVLVTGRVRGEALSEMEDRDFDDDDVTKRTKIERALQVVMADWNKLNTNFQMIYLAFDTTGRSETKYRNTISDTLGEIQKAIRGTDQNAAFGRGPRGYYHRN
jgi:hypothetical protein